MVDTLGLPWSIKVTAANISDNQAGILAVNLLNGKVPRLEKITADMGYKTTFKEHIESNYKWNVEVMQKPESTIGFVPQKNRWQVEIGPPMRVFWLAQFWTKIIQRCRKNSIFCRSYAPNCIYLFYNQ